MSTEVIMLRAGRTRNQIVAYLDKHPGATAVDLAEALGIDQTSVSSALSSLHKTGATTRWKVSHGRYAYMLRAPVPAGKQPTTLSTTTERLILPEDPNSPGQITLLAPQIDVNADPRLRPHEPLPAVADVDALKQRLAELEAFKAEAVAKHPDLVPVNYEDYRSALLTYYRVGGWPNAAHALSTGGPITPADRQRIDALIAAAKLFPEGAAQ